MIKANKYIFDILANFVEASNIQVPLFRDTNRCINTNDEEKEWLKELKILHQKRITTKFKTALFEFKNKEYFVVIGLDNQVEIENLEKIEINAGIITALLFELEVPILQKASSYEIANEIFYENQDKLTKYDFNQVLKFFEPVIVYQLYDSSPFKSQNTNQYEKNYIKLSGIYVVKSDQITSLNFSNETKNKFEQIFIEGSENIPYENLVLSLLSNSWQYSFLDLYRCIERIFFIPKLEEIHKYLNIQCTLIKFSTDIEEYLGWRPKENDAINEIIDNSPQEIIKILEEVGLSVNGTSTGKCGELIYKIRNSIVHFRPANQKLKLDDQYWDKLIRASLLVIYYWYDRYNEQLSI
jgi:hypothetical protein